MYILERSVGSRSSCVYSKDTRGAKQCANTLNEGRRSPEGIPFRRGIDELDATASTIQAWLRKFNREGAAQCGHCCALAWENAQLGAAEQGRGVTDRDIPGALKGE